jgi:hypothetical protein
MVESRLVRLFLVVSMWNWHRGFYQGLERSTRTRTCRSDDDDGTLDAVREGETRVR